jgi:hypothetical protein
MRQILQYWQKAGIQGKALWKPTNWPVSSDDNQEGEVAEEDEEDEEGDHVGIEELNVFEQE